MNMLLVHLDIVKDHHQFCDWLDSVSVMGSLIDKIKAGDLVCIITNNLCVRYSSVAQICDS